MLTLKIVRPKMKPLQSMQVPELGGYNAWHIRMGERGKSDSSEIMVYHARASYTFVGAEIGEFGAENETRCVRFCLVADACYGSILKPV